jgi:hypothetical protein
VDVDVDVIVDDTVIVAALVFRSITSSWIISITYA